MKKRKRRTKPNLYSSLSIVISDMDSFDQTVMASLNGDSTDQTSIVLILNSFDFGRRLIWAHLKSFHAKCSCSKFSTSSYCFMLVIVSTNPIAPENVIEKITTAPLTCAMLEILDCVGGKEQLQDEVNEAIAYAST